jgi:hypothetical protein
MLFRYSLVLLLGGLMATGCGTEDDTDTDTDVDTDTDTDEEAGGFSIAGLGVDLATQAPVGAGLCVSVQDPTPAITGGEPLVLSASVTADDGSYLVENITTTSSLGILVVVSDCPEATEATVMPTATGIASSSYSDLEDGDVLEGQTSFSIDAALQAGVDGSLTAAGYTGDTIGTAGTFVGFVFDAAGAPLSGATVECTGTGCDGVNTYYQDGDAADGLFTTAGAVNESTDATQQSLFWIPGAPISNYEASHPDNTFASQLAGSSPGTAVLIAFDAE